MIVYLPWFHHFTHNFTMVQLACTVLRQALGDSSKQPSSERSAARSEARWAAAKSLG